MKFIITGMHSSRKHEFMYYLEKSLPEYFKVGRIISNDPFYKRNGKCKYYNDDEITEIYNNKAFVFLWNGYGLLKNTFEENNLFTMSIEDFLMLPNRYHTHNDILVIWIDSSKDTREYNNKIFEKHLDFDKCEEQQQVLLD